MTKRGLGTESSRWVTELLSARVVCNLWLQIIYIESRSENTTTTKRQTIKSCSLNSTTICQSVKSCSVNLALRSTTVRCGLELSHYLLLSCWTCSVLQLFGISLSNGEDPVITAKVLPTWRLAIRFPERNKDKKIRGIHFKQIKEGKQKRIWF